MRTKIKKCIRTLNWSYPEVKKSAGIDAVEWAKPCEDLGPDTMLPAAAVFHFRTVSIRQIKEFLQNKGLKVII